MNQQEDFESRIFYDAQLLLYVSKARFRIDTKYSNGKVHELPFFEDEKFSQDYDRRKDSEKYWVFLIHTQRWGFNPAGRRRLPQLGLLDETVPEDYNFAGIRCDSQFIDDPQYRLLFENEIPCEILNKQLGIAPQALRRKFLPLEEMSDPSVKTPKPIQDRLLEELAMDDIGMHDENYARELSLPQRAPDVRMTGEFFDGKESRYFFAEFVGRHRDIHLDKEFTGLWVPMSDLENIETARTLCKPSVAKGISKAIVYLKMKNFFK